jgi:hypothetical protein
MNFKNKFFYSVTKNILSKNNTFKGIHRGESCYFFGNAKSLKYYDLSLFNDKVSIGCNFLFLHKDFNNAGVNYYYNGDPFFLYPYAKNLYTKKFKKNAIGKLFVQKVKDNPDINYFINISDYPMLRGKNIFYLHHFGEHFTDYSQCGLDTAFTATKSALSGMLGIAIYLGFKDATLVGFDHLLKPKASEHFYEYGKLDQVYEPTALHEKFLIEAQKFLNLRVVSPNDSYKGHIIPHINYEHLTGKRALFRENTEIIENRDLEKLRKSDFGFSITKNEFLNNNPDKLYLL